MPTFTIESQERLKHHNASLQMVLEEAIKVFNFAVVSPTKIKVEGKKKSIVTEEQYHSNVIFLAPIEMDEINKTDVKLYCLLAGAIKAIAMLKGIVIKWKPLMDDIESYGRFEI